MRAFSLWRFNSRTPADSKWWHGSGAQPPPQAVRAQPQSNVLFHSGARTRIVTCWCWQQLMVMAICVQHVRHKSQDLQASKIRMNQKLQTKTENNKKILYLAIINGNTAMNIDCVRKLFLCFVYIAFHAIVPNLFCELSSFIKTYSLIFYFICV